MPGLLVLLLGLRVCLLVLLAGLSKRLTGSRCGAWCEATIENGLRVTALYTPKESCPRFALHSQAPLTTRIQVRIEGQKPQTCTSAKILGHTVRTSSLHQLPLEDNFLSNTSGDHAMSGRPTPQALLSKTETRPKVAASHPRGGSSMNRAKREPAASHGCNHVMIRLCDAST